MLTSGNTAVEIPVGDAILVWCDGTDIYVNANAALLGELTLAADKGLYSTAANAMATYDLTSYGRSIGGVADEAAFKALVNLEIGTDVQAYDAFLGDIAALTDPNADSLIFWDDSAGAFVFCTLSGLSFSGTVLSLAASPTFTAPTVTTLELGGTTDTTLSRDSAGVAAVEGSPLAFRRPNLNAQTGASYTLALTDAGGIVTMTNASANTLSVPTNASVAFTVGEIVNIVQGGAGVTTITGDTGVTINGVSAGSVSINTQYQGASLLKTATNTWIVSGDVGAAS
jgi:hypothetical protein